MTIRVVVLEAAGVVSSAVVNRYKTRCTSVILFALAGAGPSAAAGAGAGAAAATDASMRQNNQRQAWRGQNYQVEFGRILLS